MRKRITAITLAAVLAAGQSVCVFASNSPNTRPVIMDSGSEGSDSSSWSGSSRNTESGTSAVSSTSVGRDTVQIPVGQAAANTGTSDGVETNSRGQAVIGDTALEFVQGSDHAVIGLPDAVVASINGINEGKALSQVVPGLELTGYYALSGTHALMTKTLDTNEEKTGAVEFPLYVPNLMEGLGTVQVLFYDNMLGQWRLITPNRIDAGAKTLWMTVTDSGTISVVYKKQ